MTSWISPSLTCSRVSYRLPSWDGFLLLLEEEDWAPLGEMVFLGDWRGLWVAEFYSPTIFLLASSCYILITCSSSLVFSIDLPLFPSSVAPQIVYTSSQNAHIHGRVCFHKAIGHNPSLGWRDNYLRIKEQWKENLYWEPLQRKLSIGKHSFTLFNLIYIVSQHIPNRFEGSIVPTMMREIKKLNPIWNNWGNAILWIKVWNLTIQV